MKTDISIDDKANEECGIFGISSLEEAANYVYLGLHGLQHRGQEACGIASTDGDGLYKSIGEGKVSEYFGKKKNLEGLIGSSAIGHVRYSTTGSSVVENAQPLVARTYQNSYAVAHNGNIVNAKILRHELEDRGSLFQTTTDSEVILHLMSRSEESNTIMAFIGVLSNLRGAYSVLFLSKDYLIAARDPNGIRPLSIGKIDNSYVFSSETCAFDIIGAKFIRDVAPGEIVAVNLKTNELESHNPFSNAKSKFCIFEYVYFAKPSSTLMERSVHDVRYNSGKILAKENPTANADLVVPIPDSGMSAALGYSDESGIPFTMGLVRSHYIGRTFIEPKQSIRGFGVRLKFSPVRKLIENKSIVLIDDSIVRGTTSARIIKMLREVGVREIHMRISSPEIKHPCFYGIDFATKEELISSQMNPDAIAKFIGADSVGFLSIDGLHGATDIDRDKMCYACFSGDYPVSTKEKHDKLSFESVE